MRTRARTVPVHPAAAAVAATALAVAGLTAIAAPARAATLAVTDAASWADALTVASSNGQADTISLLNDIDVPGASQNYFGNEDLTIEGNGHTVAWDGTDEGGALVAHQEATLDAAFALRDITFDGFASDNWGAVFIAAQGEITLDGVTITNTTAGPGAEFLAANDVHIVDSTFTGNDNDYDDGGAVQIIDYDDVTFDVNVTGSTFDSNSTIADGGAVYAESALLIVEDSTFTRNHADEDGGAVLGENSGDISGSTFAGNTSGDEGGAVYVDWGLDIMDSTFTDNSAGQSGGAAFSWGEVTVEGSSFSGNSAVDYGGAVASGEEGVDISSSTFDANSTDGSGGAVYADYGDMSIHDSIFSGNTAGEDGGAYYGTRLLSESTTYVDNHADGMGGAIFAEGYSDIYYSTLSGNSSGGHGSAVYVVGEDYSYVETSTFAGNKAAAGVGTFVQERGYLNVNFSTFADNWTAGNPVHLWASGNGEGLTDDGMIYSFGSIYTGAMGSSSACAADAFDTAYNLDDDGTCTGGWSGEGDTAGEARLGALADNGGTTLTRVPSQDSDAIDVIPADVCLAYFDGEGNPLPVEPEVQGEELPTTEDDSSHDQRGLSRLDALEYQGGGCDAGAVEVVKDITFPVTTPMGDVTVTASGAWTQECVANLTVAEAGGIAPAGVAFPYGALAYCFVLPWEGGSVDITLALPTPVNQVYKTGATWIQVPGATISEDGMTVTYSVTDGGDLDEDGAADAYIVDPAAPGIGATFTG